MTAIAAAPPYPNTAIVEKDMAIVCLVVNIVIPGLGTIIGGVLGHKPHIGRGVAQFLLSIILVGWVWAIVTGVQLLQNAMWNDARAGARAA